MEALKFDDEGSVKVVDDPEEREQIASESKRRRKTDVNGLLQQNDGVLMEGQGMVEYGQE